MPETKFIKSRIWMILLIIVIAGISAGLLTVFNICTRERIAFNAEIKLKKSVLDVFNVGYEKNNIIDVFDLNIKPRNVDGIDYYEFYKKNRLFGRAFEMQGAGFWGPIVSLIALSPDFKVIQGIEILRQEETPGLGGRITEDEFKEQFKGKPITGHISIDAITGATMTSNAFKRIINENVKSFRKKFKKG